MSFKARLAVTVTGLLLASTQVQAQGFAFAPGSLEASINNEAIHAEYDRPVATAYNLHMNVGLLYSEQNSSSATVGTIGIQGVETDQQTYRAAIGARTYLFDGPNSSTGAAVAVGGLFYHVIPGMTHASLGGYAWYAPKITSFGDTDHLYEVGARAAYRVLANTDVFLGYRYLRVKHDDFSGKLESGLHLGFRLNF